MRGDQRLNCQIIQKMKIEKKSKLFPKKVKKNLIFFFSPGSCYQPGLKVELQIATT